MRVFSRFRVNQKKRNKWLKALNISRTLDEIKDLRICSRHFVNSDFENNMAADMGFKKKRMKLKDAAVPVYELAVNISQVNKVYRTSYYIGPVYANIKIMI